MNKQIYFYRDKPVFGLDIGHDSLKVMQTKMVGKRPQVVGYGTAYFDVSAIADGVIVQPEIIADALKYLLEHGLIGKLTAKRATVAIPSYRAFSRSMQLPRLDDKELREAVQLEAEQYIPVPLKDLYLGYTITGQTAESCELFLVAVPRAVVDSYLKLGELVGLEVVLIETTMASEARLFARTDTSDVPTVIIDFGSLSADISIFDKTTLVTGTVQAGGLIFTNGIEQKLHLTHEKAAYIKTKYGLDVSKKQKEITEALSPTLQKVVSEIRRMTRYYEERYGSERQISQVVMLGGGANMPGLGDYLTNALRIPVRVHNPWVYVDHKNLQLPSNDDKLMYATVAGLSLVNPKEIFQHD